MRRSFVSILAALRQVVNLFSGVTGWVSTARLWLKLEEFTYDPPPLSGRKLFWIAVVFLTLGVVADRYIRWDERRDLAVEVPKVRHSPVIPLLSDIPVEVPIKKPDLEVIPAPTAPEIKAVPLPAPLPSVKPSKPKTREIGRAHV